MVYDHYDTKYLKNNSWERPEKLLILQQKI